MRHHTNCSDWGYETSSDEALAALKSRCERLQAAVIRKPRLFDRFGFDTRPGHVWMFGGMTPPQCACIIGNYRGDPNCPSLTECRVTTAHDRRVGASPHVVAASMRAFEVRCDALLKVHERWTTEKGATLSPSVGLLRFVRILAPVLEQFLTIHPYMDGNGHSGRMLLFVMMARAGYPPRNWEIDSKQPYADALSAHRDGKPGALQAFLLSVI